MALQGDGRLWIAKEHAGFQIPMVFSFSLNLFLQIFCQRGLFICLLKWGIISKLLPQNLDSVPPF